MDQNNYIEVSIFEPVAEIPTPDPASQYSSKTLNTIHECNTSNISHSYFQSNVEKNIPPTNPMSNIKCLTPPEQTVHSIPNSNKPLDIDLLLRYYAANSNMERSINQLFKNADGKDFGRSNGQVTDQVCQDIGHDPLVELGAVCKICELLKESSSRSTLFPTFRVHDILTKLRTMLRRSNSKTLEEIISSDPSMKMCKYCGVISCSKLSDIAVEPRRSQPKTSYFLSTQMFPDIDSAGDDSPKAYREARRFSPRREQTTKRAAKWGNVQKRFNRLPYKQNKDSEKICGSIAVSSNVKPENYFYSNTLEQVETMVAERENNYGTQEICNECDLIHRRILHENGPELQNHNKSSKIIKQSSLKEIATKTNKYGSDREMKMASSFKNKDTTKNGSIGNCPTSMSFGKYFNQIDCKKKFTGNVLSNKHDKWGKLIKDQSSTDESNESVVKDILYETPNSQWDDFEPENRVSINSKQSIEGKKNQQTSVFNDTIPSIDVVTYLALSRIEAIAKGKNELVAQSDERTCAQSTHRHSSPVKNGLHSKAHLNSESWNRDRLVPSSNAIEDKDRSPKTPQKNLQVDSKYYKYNESVKDIKQMTSTTCLMEDDSLENCIKGSGTLTTSHESDATVFSSSSAENMIREWVNAPRSSDGSTTADQIHEEPDTLKAPIASLDVEPRSFLPSGKCAYNVQKPTADQSNLQGYNARKTRSTTISKLSKSQTKLQSSNQIISCSRDVGSEIPNGQRSMNGKINLSNVKKDENCRSKSKFGKQLLESFKRIKLGRRIRSKENDSRIKSAVLSCDSYLGNCLKNLTRRIIYNESSLKNMIDNSGKDNEMENILLVYRKVLENTDKMDWQSFQRFVEDLHPNQKDLWRDICNTINNEVKRIDNSSDGSTEICIEITSTPFKGIKHERTCSNEIVFEMDIALRDAEKCLASQLSSTEKVQLDALERASKVVNAQNDDVYDIEVVSNQAE